ncbi:MAG: hypothetical protein KDJ15_05445 [Alphaproteobacteria bacterium]|nr:hypothetical protein [Alphaproteobacteria bacterium]
MAKNHSKEFTDRYGHRGYVIHHTPGPMLGGNRVGLDRRARIGRCNQVI